MPADLTLHVVDHVWLSVDCEAHIAQELHGYFSYDVPGAKFMPNFRRKQWSGKIHLFKLRGHLLYRGLLPRLLEFAASAQYTVENHIPTAQAIITIPQLTAWASTLGLPVVPREHQLQAADVLLNTRRGIILAPTGSGKSLIIHLVVRALQKPTLIVVPTTGLVAQMVADLQSYGVSPGDIQSIQAGKEKGVMAPLVISTWQSIFELPAAYFKQFSCVIIDEVHLAKAKSLTGLLEKCTQTPWRFGFTGTLDDLQVHQLILEGLLGTVHRFTTTSALVAQQHLSPLRVKMCVVQYPDAVRRDLQKALYPDELEFIVRHPGRLEFTAQLASRARGNVLVLFNFVEKHGVPLFERTRILAGAAGRPVHFVSGAVASDEREQIRQWVSAGNNHIIVASYGTFSAGINIPGINTLIFASPSKGKIRVLQSIGRSLRLAEGKTHATLIDIVDDLRIGAHVNHAFRHAEQRAQYYIAEQFPYTSSEQPLDMWIAQVSPTSHETL